MFEMQRFKKYVSKLHINTSLMPRRIKFSNHFSTICPIDFYGVFKINKQFFSKIILFLLYKMLQQSQFRPPLISNTEIFSKLRIEENHRWHLPLFPCLQLVAVGPVFRNSLVHLPTLLSIHCELGQFHFVRMYSHHGRGLCHKWDHNPG